MDFLEYIDLVVSSRDLGLIDRLSYFYRISLGKVPLFNLNELLKMVRDLS